MTTRHRAAGSPKALRPRCASHPRAVPITTVRPEKRKAESPSAPPSSSPPWRRKARKSASIGSQLSKALEHFVCVCANRTREHARSLVASIRGLITRAFDVLTTPPTLRITVLASAIFLAALVTIRLAHSEIDLDRLLPDATTTSARPLVVVQDGRLINTGDAPARNLEVTRPRYRLIGTVSPGQSIAIPSESFSVQYEWNEGDQLKRTTRSFTVGGQRASGNERVAGTSPGVATAAQSGAPTAEPAPPVMAPSGIAATYDPATHLLTVAARTPVEVRVDGFLLRPVAVTDRDGAQYRYIQSEILVLGQNLKQGETTTFEVVFTKPQDFYSIPIYVRETGKQPVYFTVTVSTPARPQ